MPPYQQPHQGGTTPHQGGGNDEADRIHRAQLKMQLENRVRIKRGEVLDRERRLKEIEREISSLQNILHHLEQDQKRFTEELHHMSDEVKRGTVIERQEQMSLRDTTQELRRRDDQTQKLEHEIEQLKAHVAEKEKEIAEIKEETRGLMRVKEDHRRTGELEHFTVKSEGEHLHERELKLTLLGQDQVRRQNELERLNQQHHDLKHDINMHAQDLAQLESELQKVLH